jgi:hypothetical protein
MQTHNTFKSKTVCARYRITLRLVQFLACGYSNKHTFLVSTINKNCRSQLPSGLRRGSVAARLLRLWVRILEGHGCLSIVSVVCCQVKISVTSWSVVQRSLTDFGASLCVCVCVCVCDLETSSMRRPSPRWAAAPHEKKKKKVNKMRSIIPFYSQVHITHLMTIICSKM